MAMAAAAGLMILTTVAIMIMLLIPTGSGGSFTSFKSLLNNHTSGGSEKYLVGDEDIESKFVMESHISRILAVSQNFETPSTNIANQTSPGECDRPPRYDSCLGDKRNTPPPHKCGTYNRENPC